MLETALIRLDEIYVPVKRRKTLVASTTEEATRFPTRVEAIAESIIEHGQQTPIQVRPDKERYVLVEGLHRFEALKALGEETIQALLVRTGNV